MGEMGRMGLMGLMGAMRKIKKSRLALVQTCHNNSYYFRLSTF
jgi:hypothetical protein